MCTFMCMCGVYCIVLCVHSCVCVSDVCDICVICVRVCTCTVSHSTIDLCVVCVLLARGCYFGVVYIHVHVQCMRFLFGLSEVMFSDSILTDITPQDESPDELLLPMDNPAALVLCMCGKSLGVVWMRYQ